tara:strand:+ start:439 stop:711 length:273 start_codon:yes stop_codon:yes gene_type:complete
MSINIVMYTKNICPYCAMAKHLLDEKELSFTEKNAEHADIFEEMMLKSEGRRTVPQIFINDKPIGGFDDLNALNRSGELDRLIKEAGFSS